MRERYSEDTLKKTILEMINYRGNKQLAEEEKALINYTFWFYLTLYIEETLITGTVIWRDKAGKTLLCLDQIVPAIQKNELDFSV